MVNKTSNKANNFYRQESLDAENDDSYRLTSWRFKSQSSLKMFTPVEIEICFNRYKYLATGQIPPKGIIQLVENAAENFEESYAVNIEDLARYAQLQAFYSQLQSKHKNQLKNYLST